MNAITPASAKLNRDGWLQFPEINNLLPDLNITGMMPVGHIDASRLLKKAAWKGSFYHEN